MAEYHVYMMTNRSGTLYIGVTNDLMRRVREHQTGALGGFTARYKMTRLVYLESTPDVRDAIQREKQLKGWTRKRKIELIRGQNPTWRDLSDGWFADSPELGRPLAESQILPFGQNDIIPATQGTAHV